MRVAFWISFLLIAYAYVGYAMVLAVYARYRRVAVRREAITPTVSVVMAARNEAVRLAAKLENLREMEYPTELVQVVVASDGSTDGTNEYLLERAATVTPVILETAGGKAAALNAAVRQATGEILVFFDVRQTVDPHALRQLVASFADPSVGAVSGELVLEAAEGVESGEGVGIYWKIEKTVRKLESASGSVIGVTGAIYAMRRELYVSIPRGTILDDVYVPMQVIRAGRRVLFEPLAIARDRIFAEKGKEFSRKVRTLSGNYQLVSQDPWLLSPRNPVLFRFISHKLLRLAVPGLLAVMLVASALAGGAFYHLVFWLQVAMYAMAVAGELLPACKQFRPVAIASTFAMLNAAAAMAFYNHITRRDAVWVR